MVKLIKLTINGDVDDINLNLKKNEKYSLGIIMEEMNIVDPYFILLHEWEIDNRRILKLLGCNAIECELHENYHQLPIKSNYQFYGDLYVVLVSKNIIQDLDLENFENIYNALYCDSDDETDVDEDDDLEEDIYSDIEDQEENDEDEENLNLDNYGDDNISDDDYNGDMEDKKKKPIRKKKIVKILETRDLLNEDSTPPDSYNIDTREKVLNILLKLDINKNIGMDYFRELEMEIFNYSIRDSIKRNIVPTWNILFKKIYINKARSLYINLSPDSYVNNRRLFERMKKKEFTAKELVNMSIQELFPENWKHLIDEKYRKNKILYETKKEAMTDQFKCRKCKSRETCYYEMQTRSADEPMTIFITCLNCGNRWKN